MLSPAREGTRQFFEKNQSVALHFLIYWEALAGESMSRHFSLLPFVSCFPDF